MFERLQVILFFSEELWNSGAITLCWSAGVSILVLLLLVVKRSS